MNYDRTGYPMDTSCPTCDGEVSETDLQMHGECDECHDAYLDCISTDKVGIDVWENDDVD